MHPTIDERDSLIYKLWYDNECDFKKLITIKFPSCLSLKSVRNIIYFCGRNKQILLDDDADSENPDYAKELYRQYRLKCLEVKDPNKAIYWVWNNQPPRHLSMTTLRRIVRETIRASRKKKNLYKNI